MVETIKQDKNPVGRPRKVNYEQVKDLREKGLTYAMIGAQLGITRTTVHRILKNPYIPVRDLQS